MTDTIRVKLDANSKPIRVLSGVRMDELLADMIDLQRSLSRVIGHLRIMCGEFESYFEDNKEYLIEDWNKRVEE